MSEPVVIKLSYLLVFLGHNVHAHLLTFLFNINNEYRVHLILCIQIDVKSDVDMQEMIYEVEGSK